MKNQTRRKYGLTLVELSIAMAIFIVVVIAETAVFSSGQIIWTNTYASVELQQNLRTILDRMGAELHQSGNDHNVMGNPLQVWVMDGMGVNGTDVLQFSVPIICQTGMAVNNSQGNIAYWGAPLRWGCNTVDDCMDANNDCSVLEYKFIKYYLNNQNQLMRVVLSGDANALPVKQKAIAQTVIDFQVTPDATNTLYTIQLTLQNKTGLNRTKTLQQTINVYLRNYK